MKNDAGHTPSPPVDRPRPRTCVILACGLPWGVGPTTPLGTVVAPTLAAAYAQCEQLARARGWRDTMDSRLRVRRASACRRAWLFAALARDGEALRAGHGEVG